MEEINRLSLNDECKVEDRLCPKGVVVFRDQDGNIIFKGNNMVVKDGRKLLLNLFLGTSGTKTFTNINAFIGDNITMVSPNNTYSGYTSITGSKASVTIPQTVYKRDNSEYIQVSSEDDDFMIYYTNSTGTRLCGDSNKLYYHIDNNKLCIHMGINYTPEDGPEFASTFGLYSKDDTDGLFSRIVFPRRTLSSNTPLIIDYYLYF